MPLIEELLGLTEGCTSTSASTVPELNTADLLRKMRRVRKLLQEHAYAWTPPYGEVSVQESMLATQTVPAKRHKKKRNQTEAYHQRVQKKWLKRYGTKQSPAAYLIDTSIIGGLGKTLVVHPSISSFLKRA